MMRRAAPAILGALFAAVITATAMQDAFVEMTPETHRSVEKGIAWLVENQNRDGSWGCFKGDAPSVAVTSLACLALMAGGGTPERGNHAERIRKALAYLLKTANRRSGMIVANDGTGLGPLYEHSFGTLFLSQVYGMLSAESRERDDVREALKRATAMISQTQEENGSWQSNLAITANMWLALRNANTAGVNVEAISLERIVKFVDSCAQGEGVYGLAPRGGESGHVTYSTAAGLRILYGMGKRESDVAKKATEYLLSKTLGDDYGGRLSEWDYCTAFYATSALLHDEKDSWRKWYPKIRDFLVKKQNPDGSWTVEYCRSCKAYATALSLVILQTPKRLLPMFQY
ncbi:MAG: hypothetical protein A2Z34_05805 [Planctomycetes bacterium RBG_16_59_8]|nr:MAG: hypothetical protein A2Z34_05805 [Planctomycetes bacterium RBG_16_59_8]